MGGCLGGDKVILVLLGVLWLLGVEPCLVRVVAVGGGVVGEVVVLGPSS